MTVVYEKNLQKLELKGSIWKKSSSKIGVRIYYIERIFKNWSIYMVYEIKSSKIGVES